jgi:hypothetical protein
MLAAMVGYGHREFMVLVCRPSVVVGRRRTRQNQKFGGSVNPLRPPANFLAGSLTHKRKSTSGTNYGKLAMARVTNLNTSSLRSSVESESRIWWCFKASYLYERSREKESV